MKDLPPAVEDQIKTAIGALDRALNSPITNGSTLLEASEMAARLIVARRVLALDYDVSDATITISRRKE